MAEFDEAYEFDAPQFYHFRRTSVGTSQASLWFDTRECTPDKGPLAEVSNVHALTVSEPVAAASETVPVVSAAKNIVTSWAGASATAAQKPATAPRQAKPPVTWGKENGVAAQQQSKTAPKAVAPAERAKPKPSASQPPAPAASRSAPLTAKRPTARPEAKPATEKTPPKLSPRLTRSVTKKRLEEAALQHASNKAKNSRVTKSLRAALSSARSNRRSGGGSQGGATTTTTNQAGTSSARAKVANKGPNNAANRATAKAAVGGKQVPRSNKGTGGNASSGERLSGGVSKPANVARPRVGAAAATVLARGAAAQATAGRRMAPPPAGPAAAASGAAGRRQGAARGSAVAAGTAGRSLRKALMPNRGMPVRSTKPLTMPEEPRFHTSSRAAPSTAKSPFKPLVLRVQEFTRKTPPRFKTKPTPLKPARQFTATLPKEPQLRTASRARPSTLKPRAVEEEEEMAAWPAFHAQPVRPELLRSAALAPPRTERKPLTETRPFHFVSDDRAARRQVKEAAYGPTEAGVDQFKALPLDHAILEAPVRLPKKSRMSLTVPASPLLLTKTRAHEARWEEEKHEFKARPVPDFLHVPPEFHNTCEPPPLTQPQPFSLRTDRRGQTHQQKLQARVAEEEAAAEAARRVKAHAAPPTLEAPVMPPRPEPKALTVPEPFALQSEMRHDEFRTGFAGQLAEEDAQAKADAQFKARPMWRGVPYQLHPSDAPLTLPVDMHLATEHRAVDRSEFDRAVEDKARALEAEKALAAEAAARAEEEAVREYRRTLRYKANRVPDFSKPFAAAPSNRALTQPKTPTYGRKRKAQP